jgi:hypothetical protein
LGRHDAPAGRKDERAMFVEHGLQGIALQTSIVGLAVQ